MDQEQDSVTKNSPLKLKFLGGDLFHFNILNYLVNVVEMCCLLLLCCLRANNEEACGRVR